VSRTRALIVVAVVAVFVIVAGVLIYANTRRAPQNLTFNVTVTGASKMAPDKLEAHQNDTITINLSSDQEGEVHLHEYDIAFEAGPGETVSHTFKADKTCTCEIEWEGTSTELGSLVVSP
jgi:cytochrome c oxidase assembly protein Cox11